MNNEPLILNGVNTLFVSNLLNPTVPARPVGITSFNINGTNVPYVNIPTQNQFQPYPILNTLLQTQQTVPPEKAAKKVKKVVPIVRSGNNGPSYVNQEHDYIKQPPSVSAPEPAPQATHKGNVFLTINLTKYTKGINVNDICGVVLLLKNSSSPIVVNNINIETPGQTVADDVIETEVNEAIKTAMNDAFDTTMNTMKDTVETTPIIPKTEPPSDTKTDENKKQDYFNCPHCEGGFFSRHVLKNHLWKNHAEIYKKFKCLTCKKGYMTQKHLNRHRKAVHFYRCDYCKNSYEFIADFKAHIKETHTDVFYRMCRPFYCEDCDKEITGYKGDFLKHLRSHGNVICGVCAEGFPTKPEHKAHMELHPDEHFCPKCKKGFKLKDSLKAHEETHNDPYHVVCTVCRRGFKTKLGLRHHMKLLHMTKTCNYMCDRCPKMFTFPQRLVRHIKVVHEGVKDFPCPHCDKTFSSASTCKSHIDVMHLKEKPYQCEYCGKRFARRDYVINHSKIHQKPSDQEEEKRPRKKYIKQPVDCKICDKTFCSSVTLRRHLKYTHSITRKFKCRHCDLMFMFKTTRLQHEKLHKDPVNKFLCPICWKKMARKEELEAHLEEHKESNSFVCDLCSETFPSRHLLDTHVYSEHVNEEEIGQNEDEEM